MRLSPISMRTKPGDCTFCLRRRCFLNTTCPHPPPHTGKSWCSPFGPAPGSYRLTRRGHSNSAWQSCSDMQAWSTTASCCIPNRATARRQRTVGHKKKKKKEEKKKERKGRRKKNRWMLDLHPVTVNVSHWLGNKAATSVRHARTEDLPEQRRAGICLWREKKKEKKKITSFFLSHHVELLWSFAFAEFLCETDVTYLDVASGLSAPAAVLFLSVTWANK